MANELEALIRQIVSEIEGAKENEYIKHCYFIDSFTVYGEGISERSRSNGCFNDDTDTCNFFGQHCHTAYFKRFEDTDACL